MSELRDRIQRLQGLAQKEVRRSEIKSLQSAREELGLIGFMKMAVGGYGGFLVELLTSCARSNLFRERDLRTRSLQSRPNSFWRWWFAGRAVAHSRIRNILDR